MPHWHECKHYSLSVLKLQIYIYIYIFPNLDSEIKEFDSMVLANFIYI